MAEDEDGIVRLPSPTAAVTRGILERASRCFNMSDEALRLIFRAASLSCFDGE